MQLFNLTLGTPEENLALDEALLEQAESAGRPSEVLRLWESPTPVVIVGRSSRLADEVRLQACQELAIPVLRRVSGGAAIVAGPGCLMYALVLSYELRPQLRAIDVAHAFVLETIVRALEPLCPGIARQGTSDLALGDRKFSGNSMRARRDHFLYHGTLLYDFALPLLAQCLSSPPRQPEYRAARDHSDFVTNILRRCEALQQAMIDGWQACDRRTDWPQDLVRQFVSERYSRAEWNDIGTRDSLPLER